MSSTLPRGPYVLVLKHTIHCFVVDTTVLRFSVGVIVPMIVDDDYTVSPSEFALVELPSLLFFLFFHRRKMHGYLFWSCSNVDLEYTTPSSCLLFAFEIHPIYDVIFKTYRFNWVNLVIYRWGLRSAFGTAFCIVRFFIVECCTDRNTTLELKVFEVETVLVIRTYVIGWF